MKVPELSKINFNVDDICELFENEEKAQNY